MFKTVAKVWMMGNEDLDFTYLDGRVSREEGWGWRDDGVAFEEGENVGLI